MESRSLGKTGLTVSTLGFGCGNVGGLIIRGTPAERERAVARAIELGINYFDTAPSYGDGQSEQNLGQVLKALKPKVYVGTKFRVDGSDLADIPGAVGRSLDASLRRLGVERVDLLQLHNRIEPSRGAGAVSLKDVVRAQQLAPLVREGHVSSLIEASVRLAVSSDAVSTVLVGYSSLEHLESAAAAVNRGPLPRAALERLATMWSSLAGC